MTDDSAHWLASVADICERAATGDLEARITGLAGSGDFSRLCSAINHMLDVADSYVRESSAVMDYCSRGQYHRPILLRGLPGSYRDGAEIINGAALKFVPKEDLEKAGYGQYAKLFASAKEVPAPAKPEAGKDPAKPTAK